MATGCGELTTGMIVHSLTIPRGQTALAIGHAKAKDREFELVAKRGSTENGICSNPFLEHAFRTDEFRIRVGSTTMAPGPTSRTTILKIHGRDRLFHHKDRNTLSQIGNLPPIRWHAKSRRLQFAAWPANVFTREGTDATYRVQGVAQALVQQGGARKTFRLKPDANKALQQLVKLLQVNTENRAVETPRSWPAR